MGNTKVGLKKWYFKHINGTNIQRNSMFFSHFPKVEQIMLLFSFFASFSPITLKMRVFVRIPNKCFYYVFKPKHYNGHVTYIMVLINVYIFPV